MHGQDRRKLQSCNFNFFENATGYLSGKQLPVVELQIKLSYQVIIMIQRFIESKFSKPHPSYHALDHT